MSDKKPVGFAGLPKDVLKRLASKGGAASHKKGTGHRFTKEEASAAGKKGGLSISADREHMSRIGRAGGAAVSADREHMAKIGRAGGVSRNRPSKTADSSPDAQKEDTEHHVGDHGTES
jgi:general stress protein YciG